MVYSVIRTCVLAGSLIAATLIPVLFPPDATGLWHIDLQNEAASERITVRIHQTEKQLSGSYVGRYQVSHLSGNLKGKDISFAYVIDGVPIYLKGELHSNTITGTYHAGDFDWGTFKGRLIDSTEL